MNRLRRVLLASFHLLFAGGVVLQPAAARAWVVPPATQAQPSPQFCIVTHFSAPQANFAAIAVDSQSRYASRHGYLHAVFEGHISGDAFVDSASGDLNDVRGGGLYWQKLTAVQAALDHGLANAHGGRSRCDWVMWMDADAVITNETVRLEDLVATYAPPAVDVILAAEHDLRLNSGIFFVRNAPGGQAFVADVAALYPSYRNRFLPDQDAVTAVAFAGPLRLYNKVPGTVDTDGLRPGFALTQARVFDSLYRPYSHSATSQWEPCDFVAHISGVAGADRPWVMQQVLATRGACEGPQAGEAAAPDAP